MVSNASPTRPSLPLWCSNPTLKSHIIIYGLNWNKKGKKQDKKSGRLWSNESAARIGNTHPKNVLLYLRTRKDELEANTQVDTCVLQYIYENIFPMSGWLIVLQTRSIECRRRNHDINVGIQRPRKDRKDQSHKQIKTNSMCRALYKEE